MGTQQAEMMNCLAIPLLWNSITKFHNQTGENWKTISEWKE